MGQALECAECDALATVLIVHPRLFRTVVPACGRHGELVADFDIYPVDSPEVADWTVLRGHYVPTARGGG
jgi:hypothetical protein